MSTCSHCPGACAAPVLHRVVRLPSFTLAGEPPGSVVDAVIPQVLRSNGVLWSLGWNPKSAMDHQFAPVPVWTSLTYCIDAGCQSVATLILPVPKPEAYLVQLTLSVDPHIS